MSKLSHLTPPSTPFLREFDGVLLKFTLLMARCAMFLAAKPPELGAAAPQR
jgi:hypothetical protein